jgi:hypothetical protein
MLLPTRILHRLVVLPVYSIFLPCILTLPVSATASDSVLNERDTAWKVFAERLLSFHEKQIGNRDIVTTEEIGDYKDNPQFYVEISYIDSHSNLLLSRIRWERERPGKINVIEVFVYDENKQVARDYAAAFLPEYYTVHKPNGPGVPVQTLINLHNHAGKLHAFRSFDATGEFLYEACRGSYQGIEVDISTDDSEITGLSSVTPVITARDIEQICYGPIPDNAAEYLDPH